MNNLNDYIFDYAINESMLEILDNETINESAIINGIKKIQKEIQNSETTKNTIDAIRKKLNPA